MITVRTRFAPSPTGTPESIHLGFVIRALWNYAYAKKNKGQFVLRIEDTDQKRSREDTEKEIYKVLKKFGINWAEGPDIGGPHAPYRQSERLTKYQEAAHKLVREGFAYYDLDAATREKEEIKEAYKSKEKLAELKIRPKAREESLAESVKRVESGEPYVVRVKIPEDKVFEYYDWIIKKKIKFFGKEVPDMILLKSDGFPTYHLAVVVDDIDMKISHVFRGQEWITSTPIHLYVYEGLHSPVPEIGHFSVILDPRTNKKFSKRDMTALFGVDTWLDKGYLPEAILNYLMLLGWAPKDNKEMFSLDEFVNAFDQDGVQKANPTFNKEKLDWFQQQYLQTLTPTNFYDYISKLSIHRDKPEFNDIALGTSAFMPSRMVTVTDYDQMTEFFYTEPQVDSTLFVEGYIDHLNEAAKVIGDLDEWNIETLNTELMKTIKEKGYKTGDFFMNLRIVLTGKKFTPPINDSIILLGRDKTLSRIKKQT
jgi:glutamyl-tRNA synthetase